MVLNLINSGAIGNYFTGSRDANAVQLAESILYQFEDLRGINNAGIEELCQAARDGQVKAAQIKAALELGAQPARF